MSSSWVCLVQCTLKTFRRRMGTHNDETFLGPVRQNLPPYWSFEGIFFETFRRCGFWGWIVSPSWVFTTFRRRGVLWRHPRRRNVAEIRGPEPTTAKRFRDVSSSWGRHANVTFRRCGFLKTFRRRGGEGGESRSRGHNPMTTKRFHARDVQTFSCFSTTPTTTKSFRESIGKHVA